MDLTTIMGEPTGLVLGVALALGGLLLVVGSIAVMLTVAGFVLALLFFKTRQIVIPEVTLFILNLAEVPIQYLLWVLGVEEDIVTRMIIEVRNMLYMERYNKVPYNQRAIFIPQCLRSPTCPAPLTPEGINCLNCGKCGIGQIKEESEALGYKVFIAPGGSLIKRMVKKYRPKAILGIGCPLEVKEGTAKMASYGLPVQGIILERDGCVDTRVDVVKLMERIKSHHTKKGHSIEEDEKSLKKASDIAGMWGGTKPVNVEVVSAKKSSERGAW